MKSRLTNALASAEGRPSQVPVLIGRECVAETSVGPGLAFEETPLDLRYS